MQITVLSNGTLQFASDSNYLFDDAGDDDVSYEVVNQDALAVMSLNLTGASDAFALDNDEPADPSDVTITPTSGSTGSVGFAPALTPGASAYASTLGAPAASTYFSLEDTVSSGSVAFVPSTTTVTSSVNPSVTGQSVTFTATVTSNTPNEGTAQGSVAFSDTPNGGVASTLCASVPLNASGVATCTTSALVAISSPYAVSASYSGDFLPSGGSVSGGQTVSPDATTTALVSSSGGSSQAGQSVTYTATVSANAPGSGTPLGSVSFSDTPSGGSASTLCASVPLAGGVAKCTTTALVAAGSPYTITATYSPSPANYSGSTKSVTETVSTAVCSASGCSGTVVTSNEDLTVTSPATQGTINVVPRPTQGAFVGCNDPLRHAPQFTLVTDSQLANNSILFTITFANSAASGFFLIPFGVCYNSSPTAPFTDLLGHRNVTVGLLPLCLLTPKPQSTTGPCVESISERLDGTGTVTEKILVPPGDPTFH